MKRFKQVLVASVTFVAMLIAVRYYRHQRDLALALPIIRDLGGHVGSLPNEPFGTEYYISFQNRVLSRSDLDRLVALNPLASRNPVMIVFEDSGLTADDIQYVQKLVPNARVTPLSEESQ
jgi:hypothetical protein